mgnify:CR=1 FL=1|tara:strand:- start:7268 stop:8050 length:783 start_codon:yes stop_codon:yes gene_type:complete
MTDREETPQPAIILIEPQLGENIGAAARAMLNFGLTDMRLVAPRDGWPNERAIAMASHADEVLERARIFATTEEAIADLNYLYATTARRRDVIKEVATPRAAAAALRRADGEGVRCGILFGKESVGLSKADVALADSIISVPLNPDFSSINLAQAVLLVAYEYFQAGDATPPVRIHQEQRRANKEELTHLFERIETELEARGYFEPIRHRRKTLLRNMRNMFQRLGLMESDVRAFQGIIKGLALPRREIRDDDRKRNDQT